MLDIISKLGPTDWVALIIGLAAFAGTIWSNIVAYRALKASGQQRAAEFRKEWIDSLRIHLAEFHDLIARRLVFLMTNDELNKQHPSHAEKIAENILNMNSHFDRCRYLKSYIILMLDKDDSDHVKLQVLLDQILAKPLLIADLGQLNLDLFNLISTSRTVINSEFKTMIKKFN